jgi:hypothetical protein
MMREATMRRLTAICMGAILALSMMGVGHAEPWPYQPFDQTHGLGNHFGEYQNYGGSAYYHDGIDLVTPAGPVQTYSVSTGTVTHLTFNDPLYSGIMIGQPLSGGQGWLYWHINATTFQYDIGDPVSVNAYIGTTASWPVSAFHHTHFNKVIGTGGYPWNWYEAVDNPLLYMEPHTDPDRPVFETTYNGKIFAFRRQGASTILDPNALTGDVDIISKIKDIVGLPQWGLNPVRIEYQIDGAVQSVPTTLTVSFTGHIPLDSTIGTIYSTQSPLNTQGNYDYRNFYFIVTNTDGDGMVESTDGASCWQTGGFAPGDYWVYVHAMDIGGNAAVDSMMCTVAGATAPVAVVPELSHDFGGIPVGETASWDIVVRNTGNDPLSVREVSSSDAAFLVNRSHFFVPPGGEVPITVRFTPGAVQAYGGTIRIRTNDLLHAQFNVSVQGSGLDPAAVSDAGDAARFGVRGTRAIPGGFEVVYAIDRSGDASLEVFDPAGRRLRTLEMQGAVPGLHSWVWNGNDEAGRRAPAGVYFIRLRCGQRVASGSGVILK